MPNKLVYSDIRVINELTAAQLTVHNEYSLPLTDGTANQVMVTDGAGQVQFVDLASISPTPISISNGTGINWSLVGSVYTGNVTLSPFSTTNLAEGVNMYFTYERVDDRVAALIQNGTGISWSYNDIGDTLTPTVTLAPFSTTNLAEGTNQYFTAQRVFTALLPAIVNAAPSPSNPIVWQYNAGPKTILPKVSLDPFDTDDLSEGSTNCYHTTNRAQDAAATIFTSNPGLHTGIAFSYNTGTNEMTATVSPVPIEVQCNGTTCGTQSIVNFCSGNDIGLTISEDLINGCVNVTIDSCVCTPVILLGAGAGSTYRKDNGNNAIGDYSTVSGGYGSSANCCSSTIGGGEGHTVDGNYASIGGGFVNLVESVASTIGGGRSNQILCNYSEYSVISGGRSNTVSDCFSSVISGCGNSVLCGRYSVIAGGRSNSIEYGSFAQPSCATIVGGGNNKICSTYGNVAWTFVGGGFSNTADSQATVVVGGSSNTNSGSYSFIGGGLQNTICYAGVSNVRCSVLVGGRFNCIINSACSTGTEGTTIVGGLCNLICDDVYTSGSYSFIGGGLSNTVRGESSAIPGGIYNTIQSCYSSIAGGYSNCVDSDYSTVSGGYLNYLFGNYSSIAGGSNNCIDGAGSTTADHSFIGGGNHNEILGGSGAAIVGGCCNTVCNDSAAVLGGSGNFACHDYAGVFGCNITTVAACTFHVNNLAVTTAPTVAPSSIALLTRDQTTGVVNTRYMGGLYSQIADGATVANTAVETSIIGTGCGSLTVAANGFTVGDAFEATLAGKVSTGNGQTLTFQLKSGAVVLATTGAITMANGLSNCNWSIQSHFTIRAIGAAGVASILTNGQFGYNDGTAIKGADFSSLNNTTFDTTISNTLSITATWGAANVLNSFVSCEFVLSKTY